MGLHTSHAALFSIAGIVAANVLGQVCGHAVDLTTVDIPAMGASLIALFLDMKKRWAVATP